LLLAVVSRYGTTENPVSPAEYCAVLPDSIPAASGYQWKSGTGPVRRNAYCPEPISD